MGVGTYRLGNIMPPSRAMEYKSREAEVMHPIVPLMKHTASMTVRTTVAAREDTARWISSVIAMPVLVEKTRSGEVRLKSMTRMNAVPLVKVLD